MFISAGNKDDFNAFKQNNQIDNLEDDDEVIEIKNDEPDQLKLYKFDSEVSEGELAFGKGNKSPARNEFRPMD